MKKLINLSILSFLMFLGFNANAQAPEPTSTCSVSCFFGSCNASCTHANGAAVCTCAWGTPTCGCGGGGKITASTNQLNNINLAINYLLTVVSPTTTDLRNKLTSFNSALLADNQVLLNTLNLEIIQSSENLTPIEKTNYQNFLNTLQNN